MKPTKKTEPYKKQFKEWHLACPLCAGKLIFYRNAFPAQVSIYRCECSDWIMELSNAVKKEWSRKPLKEKDEK